MNKIFDLDNPIMRFLGKLFDLMHLNLLFIICSIPIFTIGASLTAMYSVALKMVKNEETYIGKDFFKSFRMNFKQGTAIWFIFLFVGWLLYTDTQILNNVDFNWSNALRIAIFAISLIFICMFTYVFPILARFINSVKVTIKNSLLMCIAHLPYTGLFLLIDGVILFIATRSGYALYTTCFVGMIGGIAGVAYIQAVFFRKIFARYEPEEEPSYQTDSALENASRTVPELEAEINEAANETSETK